MKQTTPTLAIIVLTTTLATSTGAVIASNDEHDRQYTSSDDATTVRDDDDRNAGTRLSNAALADDVRAADSPHWRVTHAMNDAQGRLSELHYVVPLHDMSFFGQVTSAITESGLTIDYADGLFVEADADMDEPHYHFVQTFKVS